MPQEGDRVKYVPDMAHAHDQLPDGSFVWQFGTPATPPAKGLRTVDDKEAADIMKWVRQVPDRANVLVPLRPQAHYAATVKAVHADGSADLDIAEPRGLGTLGYPKVPHDPAGKTPHSYHAATQGGDA